MSYLKTESLPTDSIGTHQTIIGAMEPGGQTAPRGNDARYTQAPGDSRSATRFSRTTFLVFFVFYLVSWGGHYTSGDGFHKIAWAKFVLFGASSGVHPDSNGIYSKYGVGHTLIAIPALVASTVVQKLTGIRSEAAFYTLIFVANGALLMALISYYLVHFYSPKRVWLTIALIGLATTWWPYTKMDFSEVLVATILFAGFVLMRFGRPVAGMLLAGLTLTIRMDAIVPITLLALWALAESPSLRAALKFGAAILPSLAIVAASNYIRYHSVFDRGYAGEGFTTPVLTGMYGILFSAGKSVFLFSPPLILGFLGWIRFRARPALRRDALLFAAIFLSELLIYSKWWDWSSDDAWGVRFMIPAVVLMCIPAIEVLDRRILFTTVAAAGLLVQLLAVLPGGLDYLMLMRNEHSQRTALFVSGQNRVDIEDIRFNPHYSQLAGNWILLRHLLHIPPRPSQALIEKNGTPLYDALAPQEWSHAAHWDLVWVRALPRKVR